MTAIIVAMVASRMELLFLINNTFELKFKILGTQKYDDGNMLILYMLVGEKGVNSL